MNVAMILEMAADGLAGRVAVGSRQGGLTYDALREAAAARGTALSRSGPGILALLDSTSPAVPLSLFASAWAGWSYAPVNYRLPPAVLAGLVSGLAPDAVVCNRAMARRLGGSSARLHTSEEWVSEALSEGPGGGYPDDPGRPAVLLHTSGTTSAPKVATLEHVHLLSYVMNTLEFASAGEEEALLLSVPPFHVAGVAAVLSACYTGRRIVPLPHFSPQAWLETALGERVTHAFVVPTMLARIVAAVEAEPDMPVPALRSLSYGGARTPLPVLEKAMELFPRTGFVNAYGLTETSSTVAVLGPEEHRDAAASQDPDVRARLGSAGRAVPGIEILITDDEGAVLAPGQRGEIRVRGEQVGGRYLSTKAASDETGLLHTGDLGWMDEAGYLFVSGRADDMIIRGGENISPSEIEDALLRHPDVVAAAVVGIPDQEWGESVAAMVSLREDARCSPEEVRSWAREAIGTLKAPERIVIAEEIPVTTTGKVLRREVRKELAGD